MTIEVINNNCIEAMRAMPPASIDCIITDPPYGETKLAWDRWVAGWPTECARLLKPSGSMWVFGSMRLFLRRIGEFDDYQIAQDVVWEKQNGSGFHNDRFRRVHELAVQFYLRCAPWQSVYKEPQYTNDARARIIRKKSKPAHWHGAAGASTYVSADGGPRLMRSVLRARNSHRRSLHPTQKPLELVESFLKYSCAPGGVVLDPFAGSGTTGVAAQRMGVSAILIDVDQRYCEVARQRLSDDRLPLLSFETAS